MVASEAGKGGDQADEGAEDVAATTTTSASASSREALKAEMADAMSSFAAAKKNAEEAAKTVGPRLVVPSPEPAPVDDTIVKHWNKEVDRLTEDFRRASQGLYCINSRRTLTLPINQRGCPVPFSGWLSDPGRVVGLVYPPKNLTRRGDQVYEIELVQMSFFGKGEREKGERARGYDGGWLPTFPWFRV